MPSQTIQNEKTSRKRRIRAIFQTIHQGLHHQNQAEEQDLHWLLQEYERSLIEELHYLDPRFDHPVRAAEALLNLAQRPSTHNFQVFQSEATNSKFNPNARALAWGLCATFYLSLASIAVCTAVFASTIGLPFIALLTVTAVPIGLMSLPFNTSIGALFGLRTRDQYSPVLNSIKNGNNIAHFFQPVPTAIPVQEYNAVEAASLPTALPA